MKHTIFKLLMAGLCCLLAATDIQAETIEVVPGFSRLLSIYDTSSQSASNSYGDAGNDVSYRFRIEHPTVFLAHNGGSKLNNTSMYLLRRDIDSSDDKYREIFAAHGGAPSAGEHPLINALYNQSDLLPEELDSLQEGQALVCMQLARGEYELVCEGSASGNDTSNGEIHTSFYACQAGYQREYPIDLGMHTCNFSYKEVGLYNIGATHKHYVHYKVHIGYPMQLKVEIPTFKKILIELLDETGMALNNKTSNDNYLKTVVSPGIYFIRTGTYDRDIWQETNISLTPVVAGNCLESSILLIPSETTGLLSYSQKFNTKEFTDNYQGKPTHDICLALQLADSLLTTINCRTFELTDGIDLTLLDSLQQVVEQYHIDGPDGENIPCFIALPPGKHFLVCEGSTDNGGFNININGILPYREKKENYTPSEHLNYIRTIVPRASCNTVDSLFYLSKATHQVRYFDHLGRPVQENSFKASPQKDDLIVRHDYDLMGRDWKQWLTIHRTNEIDSESKLEIFNRTAGTYLPCDAAENLSRRQYADTAAYSLPVYENALWNRIAENYGAGEKWQSGGRSQKTTYAINTHADSCLHFIVEGEREAPQLIATGYYPASCLDVVRTEDEDGHAHYSFTDKWGHTVLTRQMNGHEALNTYYVYDDYGNLCFVLPPAALQEQSTGIAHEQLDKYAYQYRYDYRNRCIGKKMPGCLPTEMIYDANDRLVFIQDGEQRKRSEWSFTFSDLTDRSVLSGIYKGTPDRKTCEGDNIYAVFNGEAPNNLYGYTLNLPEGIIIEQLGVLKANYYDNYEYRNCIAGFDNTLAYEQDVNYGKQYDNDLHCKQLLTGSIVCVLDDRKEFKSCYYYDFNRNLIQTRTITHTGNLIVNKAKFNFSGEPVKVKVEHAGNISLRKEFSYDHVGRLTTEKHIINEKDTVSFSHKYDELGKLVSLARTAKGGKPITTSYKYNIRNWLISTDSPFFVQKLHYTDGVGTPCYNGNISSMTWQTDTLTTRGYQFTYDGLSRLKDAVYGEGTDFSIHRNRFNEQVTGYDKIGNILGLKRYGQTAENDYGVIDSLFLTYNGNQLEAVNDSVTNTAYQNNFEFKDSIKLAIEYSYDANGSLTQDLNKKITDIQYNCLNLPRRIQFEDGNTISFLYDANGTKLRTTHIIDGITTTTDYSDNAIYENGVLNKLMTEYGYVTLSDTTYHYFLQDHQGNNRAVVNQDSTVEEVNHYYPFGGVFASTSSVQPYKYNGKELDKRNGLDWYDYGARMYDPLLGRFTCVDPLAEAWAYVNPYDYCFNNPINRTDPTGMASMYNWDKERYEDENGNEVSWESVKEEYQIGDNGNASGQQESDHLDPISPEVNATLTPWGTAASLHAGLRYTEHPFGGGYFRTKKGKYFSMNIFQQPAGTKLARKAKGMVNSAQAAKSATKLMRVAGNAVGLITSGISAYNFSVNPNFRDGSDFVFGIGSLAYWEIGLIYLMGSSSYDTSVENQKQIIENINNGVPASLGTFNLQRGMFW